MKLENFRHEIVLALLHIGFDFYCIVVLCSQQLLLIQQRFVGLNLLLKIRFNLLDADGTIEVVSDKLGAERRWNVPFLANIYERCDLKEKLSFLETSVNHVSLLVLLGTPALLRRFPSDQPFS